jgi:hypothetical protein
MQSMKRNPENLYIQCNTTDEKYLVRDRAASPESKPLATCRSWSEAQRKMRDFRVEALKAIGQQKRQRKVFPTSEIPHLWFHQTQSDARSQGNISFDGDTIYSYGSHFPIARHVKSASGRKSAVLFTTRRYSVTTSGHCSSVRQAIPSGTVVFDVPNVRSDSWSGNVIDHAANLEHFVKESQDALAKSRRARSSGEWELKAAFGYRETAKAYASFFRVPCPKFDFLPTGKELKALKAQIAERAERHKASQAQAAERERVRQAERDRIEMLDFAEKSALWRAGNPNVRLPYSAPALLRIVGDDVETSKGARVPVTHAIAGLAVVRKIVARGREYVRNGHTIHLGHYAIDKIAADGTLTAGCHVISLAEIEALAPALDAWQSEHSGIEVPNV